jgi:hypothetical protein
MAVFLMRDRISMILGARLPKTISSFRLRLLPLLASIALGAGPLLVALPHSAAALSEIKPGQTPPAEEEPATQGTDPAVEMPTPDPIKPGAAQPEEETPPATQPEEAAPEDAPDEKGGIARPNIDPNAPLAEVQYDIAKLPEPVQRMRKLLLDVSLGADIEKLRPLLGTGESTVQLSLSDITDDPIAYLKSQSGDQEGQEILAIMEDVLSAGYVHINVGKPEELYVWPYFFGLPLDKLTPRQKVELFKIVTAGDYEEMKTYDSYIFYRLGITPKGEWAFFVTGE